MTKLDIIILIQFPALNHNVISNIRQVRHKGRSNVLTNLFQNSTQSTNNRNSCTNLRTNKFIKANKFIKTFVDYSPSHTWYFNLSIKKIVTIYDWCSMSPCKHFIFQLFLCLLQKDHSSPMLSATNNSGETIMPPIYKNM